MVVSQVGPGRQKGQKKEELAFVQGLGAVEKKAGQMGLNWSCGMAGQWEKCKA